MLTIIALTLPMMTIVGWLVSRLRSCRTRAIAAAISVAVVAGVGLVVSGAGQLANDAIFVAAVLLLTAGGVGSIAGWAVRMMLSHLASAGALTVRALPVFLLTAIVFFNSYVWIMATTITGDRLGLAMTFLVHTGAPRADAAVDGSGTRRRRAARRRPLRRCRTPLRSRR